MTRKRPPHSRRLSLDEDDDGISPGVNIATGIRIPPDAAESLLNSSEICTAQMTTFLKHLGFPAQPKIKTFSTIVKKKTVKRVDETVINHS
ncbi:hypothetical protein LSAT2_024474 [Lamellibrachia satsuma]|nr:hypothetical protein LSAT2_024474 [Lamellibrachia satsuma]